MVDLGNVLILADRRVKVEDISEHLGIFMSTAHKVVLVILFLP